MSYSSVSTVIFDDVPERVQGSSHALVLPALLWRGLWLYVVLLVLLAPLGVYNQRLYQEEWDLLARKESLQDARADLHVVEASIRSPEAVRAWATAQGMIPNAEIIEVQHMPYQLEPLPAPSPTTTSYEVRSVWR